ncbi:MAG: hypothetical protein EA424_01470 [Planctomycetaceae bacterium]|jgi:2-desacetyl-2-hydroxyethyl bacteriochlorophyllide A dehydrogenase|nr:MAG: hypothetical protein EA424_01470 [Planctomycetaceae bacterium]
MDHISLVFHAQNTVRLEQCSKPVGADGQLLVRNAFSMISPGTELSLFTGAHVGFSDPEITWARYPLEPGYAAVGRVEEGTESFAAGGQRPRKGDWLLHYGTHSNRTVLDPERQLWVPLSQHEVSDFSDESDPDTLMPYLLVRFAQIAATAVLAQVRPPENVLVFGAGIVGNLCAQLFSRVAGVKNVLLVDLSPRRLAIARSCGIAHAVVPDDLDDLLAELRIDVDTVVEATGSPVVVQTALTRVAVGGQVLLLGSTKGEVDLNVYKLIHRKLVSLVGCHESLLPVTAGGMIRRPIWEPTDTAIPAWLRARSHQEMASALTDCMRNGELIAKPFIQRIVNPGDAQAVYEQLRDDPDEYLGVVLDWRAAER